MQACQAKGLTASEVVREFVESYPVQPKRRVWPSMSLPKKEPVMSLSLVTLMSAALAASTLPTQSAIGDRQDAVAAFEQMDADGDNRFDVSALYLLAGMTAEGQLSEEMIQSVTITAQTALTAHSAVIQEDVLSPSFERLLVDALETAEISANRSVQRIFDEMDTNADSSVTRAEFMAYSGDRYIGE